MSEDRGLEGLAHGTAKKKNIGQPRRLDPLPPPTMRRRRLRKVHPHPSHLKASGKQIMNRPDSDAVEVLLKAVKAFLSYPTTVTAPEDRADLLQFVVGGQTGSSAVLQTPR